MSTEKSCETCRYKNLEPYQHPCAECDVGSMRETFPLTPAQQYAPELLEALKKDHAYVIKTFKAIKVFHDEKSCPVCQLIAKAEGRE